MIASGDDFLRQSYDCNLAYRYVFNFKNGSNCLSFIGSDSSSQISIFRDRDDTTLKIEICTSASSSTILEFSGAKGRCRIYSAGNVFKKQPSTTSHSIDFNELGQWGAFSGPNIDGHLLVCNRVADALSRNPDMEERCVLGSFY